MLRGAAGAFADLSTLLRQAALLLRPLTLHSAPAAYYSPVAKRSGVEGCVSA